MKNWLIILIIFALPLGLYGILNHRAENRAEAGMTQFVNPMQVQMAVDENNIKNYEEANLPKVYIFHSPFCGECKEQSKELRGLKDEFDRKIFFVEHIVTGEDGGRQVTKDLIKKYKVTVTPTIVVTTANGTVIKKYESLVKHDELEKLLKNVAFNEPAAPKKPAAPKGKK